MNSTSLVHTLFSVESEKKGKNDLLKQLADFLYKKNYVKKSFKEALIEREGMYPTGLQFENVGISIPHTECDHVIQSAVTMTLLKTPIKFQSMENPNNSIYVKIVFVLALNNPEDHLRVLSKLTEVLQKKSFRNKVLNSGSSKEGIELFKSTFN